MLALGIMNSRSLNSPQRILLKGFYNHNSPKEFNLPRFEKENVVLAMGKFRIVDYTSEERNISIPKIILNDLIKLDVNPSCIPKFLILINMTVKVQNPLVIKDNDAIIIVAFIDHVDQDSFTIEIDYQQKLLLNSVNILWKTETTNEATGSQSISEKIATRINANDKNKNLSSMNKILSGIVEPSPANSKASTKNEDSLFTNKKTSSITKPSTTNSKNKKKLSTNKNKLSIKPSSEIAKPSIRTRTRRQLTDLAKEALANSDKQAAIFPSTNHNHK
ncbi:19675_t:CDS:2 [Gigaspora margarita]|uniref:19675_t:CDS:1 n=1 Tax=Gigaspora margarita TaxID=4874 RepID=A0ABM8W093_GIGMA|nr:19675_t:CDS:2 [Gigaspora margarita]